MAKDVLFQAGKLVMGASLLTAASCQEQIKTYELPPKSAATFELQGMDHKKFIDFFDNFFSRAIHEGENAYIAFHAPSGTYIQIDRYVLEDQKKNQTMVRRILVGNREGIDDFPKSDQEDPTVIWYDIFENEVRYELFDSSEKLVKIGSLEEGELLSLADALKTSYYAPPNTNIQ